MSPATLHSTSTGRRLLLLPLVVLLLSSCATRIQLINSKWPIRNSYAAAHVETHSFFFFGIGQSKQINAVQICGGLDKVLQVETQHTFENVIAATITLGVYTPLTVRVYCIRDPNNNPQPPEQPQQPEQQPEQ